jgi:hypothetical protein
VKSAALRPDGRGSSRPARPACLARKACRARQALRGGRLRRLARVVVGLRPSPAATTFLRPPKRASRRRVIGHSRRNPKGRGLFRRPRDLRSLDVKGLAPRWRSQQLYAPAPHERLRRSNLPAAKNTSGAAGSK